jgi:hypothetical protein
MDYIDKAKEEVRGWESEKPGFLGKAAGILIAPAEKAAEKLTPVKIQEAVGRAIEGCLTFLAKQSPRTFDAGKIRASVQKRAEGIVGGGTPNFGHALEAADERAKQSLKWHVAYAAGEGGATGMAGFAGLAADIPALFGILIRQIQEIATCYGYDVDAVQEREYMLHILRTGFASNVKLKVEFLVSLKQFEQVLLQVAWKKMAEDLAAKHFGKTSLLAAIHHFAKTLGVQITKRKALQLIPVIGAVVGASLNGTLAHDVGKAAYMSYRRRRMAENDHAPQIG